MIIGRTGTGTNEDPFRADVPDDFQGNLTQISDEYWIVEESNTVELLKLKITQLERKLERLAETGDTESLKEDPEIEYTEGVEVRTGEILVDEGEKYMMRIGGTLVMREDLRPSVLYEQQGNRTLWRKKQPDIPEENLCAETPEWNSANWNDYSAGYKVKSGSAIWEAINTTHAWIEPAHEGDGAISWKHVKDCN